jgi:formylglycine-generating enzyme required for sulfatase activity
MHMNKILSLILFFLLVPLTGHSAQVLNEKVRQEGSRILFQFDVTGDEEETDINIILTINGRAYPEKDLHLEGDYGSVKMGKGKKIYWDMLRDFPRGYSGAMEWEITAMGGPVEDMVFIKGGCIQMGCGTLIKCDSDERPVHEVCLNDFYIDTFEVTQQAYRAAIGENPSNFKDHNNPVEQVTWFEAKTYCEKSGKRLPTEAEWEYAARSGEKAEKWAGTDEENSVEDYAWYGDNSGDRAHPAGQKKPNGFGLYDMTGNVWEWVEDWYHENYYKQSPRDNPAGPGDDWEGLKGRVTRGGSWYDTAWLTRATNRSRNRPGNREDNIGFRCVRNP